MPAEPNRPEELPVIEGLPPLYYRLAVLTLRQRGVTSDHLLILADALGEAADGHEADGDLAAAVATNHLALLLCERAPAFAA